MAEGSTLKSSEYFKSTSLLNIQLSWHPRITLNENNTG